MAAVVSMGCAVRRPRPVLPACAAMAVGFVTAMVPLACADDASPPAAGAPLAATAGGVVRRTTLIVHDADASVRFYRDILGFEVWLTNAGKVTANSLPSDAPPGAPSRFVIMKGEHPWIGMVGLLEYGGPRAVPKAPPTLGEYAEALHALVAEQKEPVDLVGYHTGALVAAEIAARHPESVRRLMLVSVSLFDAERIVAEKQRAGPRAGFAMAAVAGFDAAPTLRALRVPTVVVRPEDGLWEESAAAAALIPGARLVDAPQWGYGLFDADPAGTAEVIRAALGEGP